MTPRFWRIRSLVAIVAALAALLAVPVTALASDGAVFGTHVSNCARTHGFNGTHNPGMHQGFSNWSGMC